jgi:hypothetical protein
MSAEFRIMPITILRKMFHSFLRKEQPAYLGRWGLETCIKKRNNKIDWANEDHCGTCSVKTKSSPPIPPYKSV